MNVYKGIFVFLSILCIARNVHGDEPDVAEWSFSGIAFEIILTKLEQLQDKIVNLESAMKQVDLKLSGDMSKLSQRMDEKLSGIVGAIGEQNRTITQNFFAQQNQLVSMKKQGDSIEQQLNGSIYRMDHLQDKIVEMESAIHQTDLKLSRDISKLSGDMSKRSQRMDEKLSGEISKLSQRMDKKLSGVVGAISEQNRTTAQNFIAQQNQLVSLKKQGDSIEQQLNGSIYRMDHLQDKIVEMESAIHQTDLKLSRDMSKLSGDMSKRSQRMDEKLSGDMSKLSQRMGEKLSGIVGAIGEQNRTITQNFFAQQNQLVSVKKQGESIEQKLNGVTNQMTHNVSALQAQSGRIEHSVNAQHEQMAKEIQTLVSKSDVALMMISSGLNAQNISIPSCKKKLTYPTGKYMIQPTKQDAPFLGYCEQTIFGGGWLVFQYRYDGSVDFFRNWTEYRNGFGNVDGEFWLGLERLHRLTTARPHELLVELKDWAGDYYYARYDMFQIGSEEEQYSMKELGEHTGTADDALTYHRDEMFSTVDRDNARWSRVNCASDHKGAWWYYICAYSNLNGPYRNSDDEQSMYWATNGYKSHAYTRMSIREK